MNRYKILLLTIIIFITSVGCQTRVIDNSMFVCPTLKEYDRNFKLQLARELKLLPDDMQAIERFILDYIELRAEIKICSEV